MEEDERGEGRGQETLESLPETSEALSSILHRLSSSSSAPPHLILPHLRLLRNLCAGEISNQNAFLDLGGPDIVVASLLLRSPPAPPEALRVGLQLLGNVALAGEEHRSAVWARFFPQGFLELARVRELRVCDALCMVLDTCCSADGGQRRLEELCGVGMGLPIVLEIVRTASSAGYREEWLEWLVTKICIEESYLPQLFRELSSSELRCTLFTKEQAFVLRLLSKCLSERPEEVSISNGFAFYVLKVLKEASSIVDFSSRGISSLPTGSPAIDVLGYSLIILRDVCAWEGPSLPSTEVPIDTLLRAGILELLLSFLRELEPPSIVRKSIAHAENRAVPPVLADSLKVCPYKGFRRDVLSVISICLSQRKQVQDEIRQRNMIPLLLQQCVVDEDNPFLREWGLLAVKNLLEGNLENQCEVAQLQLQEPVETPEIAELGLRVEVDRNSGRAKLVNIS